MSKPHKIIRRQWQPGNPAWVSSEDFMEEMKWEGVDKVMDRSTMVTVLQATIGTTDRIIEKMMNGGRSATSTSV